MNEQYDPNFDFATGAEVSETNWTYWTLAGGEPVEDLHIIPWLATTPAELR